VRKESKELLGTTGSTAGTLRSAVSAGELGGPCRTNINAPLDD